MYVKSLQLAGNHLWDTLQSGFTFTEKVENRNSSAAVTEAHAALRQHYQFTTGRKLTLVCTQIKRGKIKDSEAAIMFGVRV